MSQPSTKSVWPTTKPGEHDSKPFETITKLEKITKKFIEPTT